MADFAPLEDSKVISFALDEDFTSDPGELRSWGSGRRAKGSTDLRVEVEPQHQIHGKFLESQHVQQEDNASLLVFKFFPKPKNSDHRVLELILELRILVNEDQLEDEDFEDNLPELHSFEPASLGVQFFDHRVTNVTKEKSGNISLAAPTPGPTLGGEASTSTTRVSEQHDLLTVKSDHEKTDQNTKKDLVRWTLKAASPDQGIGDSFTVAVLVTRQPQSQFCLELYSRGLLGRFTDKILKPFDFWKKMQRTPLGIFGPRGPDQKVPVGVSENNLSAALKSPMVLKRLKVGVHLPELAAPVTYYSAQDTIIASTADNPSKLEKDTKQAHVLAAATPGSSALDPMVTTTAPVIHSTARTPPMVHSDVSLGQALEVTEEAEAATPRPSMTAAEPQRDTAAKTAAASPCSCQNRCKSSGSWSSPVASRADARRAERHRMMGALYERLARLHREEAEEFLPPNEVAFVEDIVRPNMLY